MLRLSLVSILLCASFINAHAYEYQISSENKYHTAPPVIAQVEYKETPATKVGDAIGTPLGYVIGGVTGFAAGLLDGIATGLDKGIEASF